MLTKETLNKNETALQTEQTQAEAKGKTSLPYMRPLADVYQKDGHIYIELEMPSAQKDSIEVTLEKGEIIVQGESSVFEPHYRLGYAEFSPVRYYRVFRMGEELDKDSIEATYKNGILLVSMRRAENISRKIQVN